MTKTRKFVVNGVEMMSQTSKIVADEMKKQQEHQLWSVDACSHCLVYSSSANLYTEHYWHSLMCCKIR